MSDWAPLFLILLEDLSASPGAYCCAVPLAKEQASSSGTHPAMPARRETGGQAAAGAATRVAAVEVARGWGAAATARGAEVAARGLVARVAVGEGWGRAAGRAQEGLAAVVRGLEAGDVARAGAAGKGMAAAGVAGWARAAGAGMAGAAARGTAGAGGAGEGTAAAARVAAGWGAEVRAAAWP